MPILARRPAFLQIGRDGFAHIDGHRQELLTPTLAAHAQMATVPVAVFELQRDDLVSAKPQTRQEQQHGAIAQADSRTEITTIDRTLRMLGRYRLGQCRRRGPGGHGWYCGSELDSHITAILRVSQK